MVFFWCNTQKLASEYEFVSYFALYRDICSYFLFVLAFVNYFGANTIVGNQGIDVVQMNQRLRGDLEVTSAIDGICDMRLRSFSFRHCSACYFLFL